MDYEIGFVCALVLMSFSRLSAAQGMPCENAVPIPHGNVKYFSAGRLVQYFCDVGFLPYGTPMLSCYKGKWRGNRPICVAPGCPRLNQPLHSIRTEQKNGAVLRHQCSDGFRMEGQAVIYCDGRTWSGTPPYCRSISAPVLPSLAPYPPENAIEDPGNATESIPQVNSVVNVGRGMRPPIFVGPSDKPPVFFPQSVRPGGAFPLYKTPGSDDEEIPDTQRWPSLPRERQMLPARSGMQTAKNNMPPILSPSQSGYSLFIPQRPLLSFRPYPMYPNGGIMPRGQPHRMPPPIYPDSLMSRSSIRRIILNRDDESVPDSRMPTNLRPTSESDESDSISFASQSERRGSVVGNVVQPQIPTVVNTGREFPEREPVEETRPGGHPVDAQDAVLPSTSHDTSFVPELHQSISVPSEDEDGSRNERPRTCPPAKRPVRGFFTIRPLPRDYEGDEYQYLVEYHCLPGLTIVSGDNVRYCSLRGRWTGQVPICKKIVNCEAGFLKQSSDRCVDIDECSTDNGGCSHKCENYPGGFRCGCNEGFEVDENSTCRDIDECSPEREKICNHFCHNSQGSFSCTCRMGYVIMPDNRTCLDVNECLERAPCEHLCQNTFGSFRCACKVNFRLNEDGRTCSEVCKPGYVLEEDPVTKRKSCADEDECVQHGGLFNCGQICNNTAGSYFCSCRKGYKLNEDQQTCSDLNECEEFSPCEYGCINTFGSYLCACPADQVRSEDNLSCIGCMRNSYMEDGECVVCPENTITMDIGATSRDECICKPGFRGNPKLNLPCADADECQDDNYGCSHDCVNTPGSVFCDCPQGYSLGPDGRNCQDRDECSEPLSPCKRGGLCRNTDGGYNCTCIRGFQPDVRNPRVCVDINECSVKNGGCQGRCHNLPGGYRCSCYASWRLDRDGKTCVPLGGSCPPLKPLVNGRVLPEAPCIRVEEAIMGRTCFYFCNGGYRLTGNNRRRCGTNGWSGESPECVAKSQCPPLEVPAGVRVVPPACSGISSLPWKMCVFSCEDQTQMMRGRRAARCVPGRGWDHKPPTCVSVRSMASNSSAIPRIKCPRDIDVDLAPGQSVAKVTITRPVTNMEITEQRNDGSTSRDIFPAGITRVKFTASASDGRRKAQCVIAVHVRDKEAPTIQRCQDSISIESSHEFPQISWQPPLFRDNVQVVKVKESRHPAGNITWGTYSVSYTASDAAGNVAECAFTIIIKRPKATQKQGIQACGQPTGPTNGRASCNSWARGVYCVPKCNPGFAFERVPPAYVCDLEGVWTPGREIPDCVDIRSARIKPTTERNKTTAPTNATAIRTVPYPHEYSSESLSSVASDVRPTSATNSTPLEVRETSTPNASSTPIIRILQKPSFVRIPLEGEAVRSRNRGPPINPVERIPNPQGVSQPRLIKLVPDDLECPRGQVPEVAEDGGKLCVNCSRGYYRPRIASAVTCIPCKPGFYQDKPGKAYCNVCPNYHHSLRDGTLQGRADLVGLTSVSQCERITTILGRSRAYPARWLAQARRRRLLRPR